MTSKRQLVNLFISSPFWTAALIAAWIALIPSSSDLGVSKEINKAQIEANKIESQEKMKALDILTELSKDEKEKAKPKKGGKND